MSDQPDRELHASDSAQGSDKLLEPLGQMVVGLDRVLLAAAERAAARSEAAAAEVSADGVAGGTAAAVLLAAAACEARLSEYLETTGVTLLP
ncbi:MAG: hypothetical protein ACREMN_11515, partial [Gemmatimonadales bacterium]